MQILYMRIWTIHPRYLDVKGFVALWRETLLAQNALLGNTKGWYNHPQLNPFKNQQFCPPVLYIANYLHYLCVEARVRNYSFVETKILFPYNDSLPKLKTTQDILFDEWMILLSRYPARSPKWYHKVKDIDGMEIAPHPEFVLHSEEM